MTTPAPAASLADIMDNFRAPPNSAMAAMLRGNGVNESEEFKRIRDLPRREHPRDLRELITQVYRTPGGTQALYPDQAYALSDLYDFRGCFAPLKVGAGKTLVSLLAPLIMGAVRPLIIVPANLQKKTEEHDMPFYRQHWRLPQVLSVISYEKLQTAKNADILNELMPDLVIADEVHFLRNKKAARTRRFVRFFEHHPTGTPPPLLAMSGTMTKRSIRDYWHIIKLCLPNQCPLPLIWNRLQEWADCVDADVPDDRRMAPGALLQFCREGETVRQGFGRRIRETPGVIISSRSAFGDAPEPGLEIHELDPGEPPGIVVEAFRNLRMTWETPGGEEISDSVSMWRHAGSLALGFYLRWAWPNGEPTEADKVWLWRRKTWHRFVRETLTNNRRNLDSMLQVFNACSRGDFGSGANAADGRVIFNEWCEVKERPEPPTEAVWISDWIINHAAEFVERRRQTFMVWTRSPHLGERLAVRMQVPYFGAGNDEIITRRNTCVASLLAHGTGKNLQAFSRALFVQTPLGGSQWEQSLGRHHRPGQEADTVEGYAYLHCKELVNGFHKALSDALYIEETTSTDQKLRAATLNLRYTPQELQDLENFGGPLWG